MAFEDAERGIGVPTIAVPDSADLGLPKKGVSSALRLGALLLGLFAVEVLRSVVGPRPLVSALAWTGRFDDVSRQLLFIPGLLVCLVAPSA